MRRVSGAVIAVLLLASGATALVTTVAVPAGASDTPGGIALDAEGNIYTADFGGTRLYRIDTDGTVRTFANGFMTPTGNAFDAAGNLYQSNYRDPSAPGAPETITKVTPRGRTSTFATGLNGPAGIAVAADGTLFVDMCDIHQVWRIDTKGRSAPFSSGPLFNCPNSITFDDIGDLYVVNFADGRIIRVRPDGSATLLTTTPGGGNGHVVYVAGSLYVTNRVGHRIYRIELPRGRIEVFAGSGTPGTVDGTNRAAQINRPNGIARNREGTALFINEFGAAVRRIDLDLKAPRKPKKLRSRNVTSSQVELSWKDRDRREESFVLQMRQGRGDFEVVQTLPWNTTSTVITSLASDTRYLFRVIARNGTSSSKPSNLARVRTAG